MRQGQSWWTHSPTAWTDSPPLGADSGSYPPGLYGRAGVDYLSAPRNLVREETRKAETRKVNLVIRTVARGDEMPGLRAFRARKKMETRHERQERHRSAGFLMMRCEALVWHRDHEEQCKRRGRLTPIMRWDGQLIDCRFCSQHQRRLEGDGMIKVTLSPNSERRSQPDDSRNRATTA